ncbi:MAG: protein-disulfide reductase DsbD [Gammaproteobacteria bacterium]|nr:protein-disulfide reductase DsbD [Gammaproteobacteria bacterium]MDH3750247.1 protein-disulfide reductase DsbD [Gammaproteobacteria bacterium]MDH3805284.1 protein-disulfide reductase DsbD [Gammaproteobacteria bacterium]
MHETLKLIPSRLFLAALLLAGSAVAQDEEPLRPEEAYRYVVTDTGGAIEIDWAIEEGYYLYRNKLGFESNNKGVVLGDARLPAGLPHEDEFFGKQQIYREHFYISVPYRITGDKPESIELVIKSQGCWDGGLCYPPQAWTEQVRLKQASAATPKLDLGSVGNKTGAMGDFPPPEEVFFPNLFAVDGNTVDVGIRVIPGYYVYKDKISVRSMSAGAMAGQLDLPKGKIKVDEFFGESEVYYDEVIGRLTIARATPEAMDLELEVNYQGCAEGGLCYLPQSAVLTVGLPEATVVTDLSTVRPSADEPVSEQGRLAKLITDANLGWVMITFVGLGLLLAFTPCVLPMIPILTSIIAGEGDDTSPMRGFTLAFSYVMGMALVYTGAGIVAAAAGAQLQATFNQPWVLIVFSGFFVLLAMAMFGGYDLQMPSGIQSRLATVSGNQKSGTTVGAFIMGALSSLIVTACVAPALIASLTVMAQTGDKLRGGAALFAMSMGMGAPLLVVGAAQGHLLPKAGGWMVAVKASFGFMLLGLAIWMLSRILPGSITLGLWAVLVFMIGVFMGGLTTLTPESSIVQKLGKGFGFLAIIYGVLLLLGALTGGSNPMKPLASVNLGAGTMVVEDRHIEFQRIKTVADLDRELAAASVAGKTAMLDFYADWCVSCIEMEEYTFTDAGVQAALSNTVLLQADVTKNDDEDKALLERFGVFGPPTIIFFGTDGQQRRGYEVVGYMKAKDFAEHVTEAFTL